MIFFESSFQKFPKILNKARKENIKERTFQLNKQKSPKNAKTVFEKKNHKNAKEPPKMQKHFSEEMKNFSPHHFPNFHP